MLGIGFGELTLVALVLIVVLGPERLPVFMKTVGKGIRGLRQASRDIRSAVGIDELLNDDMGYRPPARRPPPAHATAKIGPELPPDDPQVRSPSSHDSLPVAAEAGLPSAKNVASLAGVEPTTDRDAVSNGGGQARLPNISPPPMAVARGSLPIPSLPVQPAASGARPSKPANDDASSDGDV